MVSLGPARTPVPSLCTQTAAEGARNTETRSLHLACQTEWRLRAEALEKGFRNSLLAPIPPLRSQLLGCGSVARWRCGLLCLSTPTLPCTLL